MSTEITFTQSEHIICTLANLIEGDKSYWVAIGGQPLMAVLLARRLHAPDVCYVTEDGTVSPSRQLPPPLFRLAPVVALTIGLSPGKT